MRDKQKSAIRSSAIARWCDWVLVRLRRSEHREQQLRLIQRIAVAPKQSLALVEVEGRRLLLATGSDGSPAFFALGHAEERTVRGIAHRGGRRISW